jgi:uncharacterized membrane protein
MKAVCTQSIDIALPVERVFGYVADIARWPMWLSFVVSAHHVGEDAGPDLAAEQEVWLCLRSGKRRWRESFDVIRFVPKAFVWLEGSLSAARRIEFRFEQRRGGTRVHCAVGYPVFGGALGALRSALFTKPALARELHESARNLKNMLEDVESEDLGRASANEPLLA